jgi:hypothetical protein
MLFLYYPGCGSKYSECTFALSCVGRLTCLEQSSKKLRPCLSCMVPYQYFIRWCWGLWGNVPSSEYCRAISATASPILFRTCGILSFWRQSRSFERIAIFCCCCRVKNSSRGSLLPGSFLVFVAMRRKSTAAKDRVCRGSRSA